MQAPFTPNTVFHSVFAFDGGMNAGVDSLLLPNNQLAEAFNCTLRGNLITHRAGYQQFTLDHDLPAEWFQGACFFKPDPDVQNPNAGFCVVIGGNLFQVTPGTATSPTEAVVVTVALNDPLGVPDTLNATDGALPRQAWLWQAERWLIWQDGKHDPWFYAGSNAPGLGEHARRGHGAQVIATITQAALEVPAVNGRITLTYAAAAILDNDSIGQTIQLIDADGNDLGLFELVLPELEAMLGPILVAI